MAISHYLINLIRIWINKYRDNFLYKLLLSNNNIITIIIYKLQIDNEFIKLTILTRKFWIIVWIQHIILNTIKYNIVFSNVYLCICVSLWLYTLMHIFIYVIYVNELINKNNIYKYELLYHNVYLLTILVYSSAK